MSKEAQTQILKDLKQICFTPFLFKDASDEKIKQIFELAFYSLRGTAPNVPKELAVKNVMLTLLNKPDIEFRIIRILDETDPDLKFNPLLSNEPLILAVQANRFDIAELFLKGSLQEDDKSSIVNKGDTGGNTPMCYLSDDEDGLQMYDLLVKYGGSAELVDACRNPFRLAVDENRLDLAMHMLRGCPSLVDKCGYSNCILAQFVNKKRLELLEEFTALNPNMIEHKHHCNPLHAAFEIRNEVAVLAVLKALKGEAHTFRTPLGNALRCASKWGNLNVLQEVLRTHSHILNHEYKGETPLSIALSMRNVDAARVLLEHGADHVIGRFIDEEYTIHLAAKASGAHELIRTMASQKHRWSTPRKSQRLKFRPIHFAALYGIAENVQALVDVGAKIDGDVKLKKSGRIYRNGVPPLLLAAARAHIGASLVLIRNGASLDELDVHGSGIIEYILYKPGLHAFRAYEEIGRRVEYCIFLYQLGFQFKDCELDASHLDTLENGDLPVLRTLIRLGVSFNESPNSLTYSNIHNMHPNIRVFALTVFPIFEMDGNYQLSEEQKEDENYQIYFRYSLALRLLESLSIHVDVNANKRFGRRALQKRSIPLIDLTE